MSSPSVRRYVSRSPIDRRLVTRPVAVERRTGVDRRGLDAFVRSAAVSGSFALVSAERVEAMVLDAYRSFLRREPDPDGYGVWVAEAKARANLGDSERHIAQWLADGFKASPEYEALELVDARFQELLGRSVSEGRGYWHERAVTMRRDEGRPIEEVARFVEEGLEASDEYRLGQVDRLVNEAFLEVLGREAGGPGLWHDVARAMVRDGRSLEEISSFLRDSLRASDEYKLAHLDECVAELYELHLGRAPDAEGLAHWVAVGEAMREQGRPFADVRAEIERGILESEEYRARVQARRRASREDIYLRQPNGWTCAPTSLTMALAAFGLRPATYETVWDMVAQTGTNAAVGLPGSAAWLAEVARRNGLEAEYSPSREVGPVRSALEQGKGVLVNGSLSGNIGHFIYLAGLDEQGRYIVCDPINPGVTRWTDADLWAFTHRGTNPPGFAAVWR